MKAFNFGDDMIDWVNYFFTERLGHILMGGHLTIKILLEQGNMMTPFIFIIAVEILLIKTTKSKNIKEIKLESQEEIRAQTFADDTSLLIQRCILSLMACLSYIESFRKLSGLSANLDNTEAIPIGKIVDPKKKKGKNFTISLG